eukprot:CAMPEP_0180074790 /NCGR_PEP_ID=MMETSP0985-20121206/14127_1 /TAXON_ID=483367 /ORGANISM="non described non described, Strain CCMP 2436" /LENGTH=131 /DNA_ID=CAMNT_0022006631 /DNA_START=137 /DNA_END=528 /DNA_ORIENTATION=-
MGGRWRSAAAAAARLRCCPFEPAAAQPVPSRIFTCADGKSRSHRLLHHLDQLRHEVVRRARLDLLSLLGAPLLEVGDRPTVVRQVAERPDVVQVAGEHAHGRGCLAIDRVLLATREATHPRLELGGLVAAA